MSVTARRWATPYLSWAIFGIALMCLVAVQCLLGAGLVPAGVSAALGAAGFIFIVVGHWCRSRSEQTRTQRALLASAVLATLVVLVLLTLMITQWSVSQGWSLVGGGVVAAAAIWFAPIVIDRWVSTPDE